LAHEKDFVTMKIYIIGGAGSGKTFISKKLSQKLDIPTYSLDDIYWKGDNDFREKEDKKILLEKFKKIISNKSWIIEGAYFKWIDDGLKLADYIVLIKLHRIWRTYWILKRYLGSKIIGGRRKETFYGFYKLVKWNWKYDKEYMPLLLEKVERSKKGLIIIKSKKEMEEYLQKTVL